MENLIAKLQAQVRAHPSHPILQRILPGFLYLLNSVRPDSPDVKRRYDELHRDLGMLATQGYWIPSREDEDALRALKTKLGLLRDDTPPASHDDTCIEGTRLKPAPNITSRQPSQESESHVYQGEQPIVQPPHLSTPLLPVSASTSTTALPIELVQILNETFFLHLLATDPQRVLSPGKSLLSVMSAPRSNSRSLDEKEAKLEERVKDMVYSAFWKEALESLSSSSADTQLPRLRRLYEDIFAALQPLLPKNHPVLVMLSLPLSPTSAPLRSAVTHLRDVLVALRTRAAPVRDAHIDTLIQALDGPGQLATTEDLARLVVDTARSILELAELMKEDLSQLVLGSMDEQDLEAVITQQAMLREKALVLQLWPPSRVEPAWTAWLDGLDMSAFPGAESAQPARRRWVYRLVQALGNPDAAVSCPLPPIRIVGADSPNAPEPEPKPKPKPELELEPEPVKAAPNALPPPFFVVGPALLAAQNYLQALVIAACLRSLVRLPPRPAHAPAAHRTSTPASAADGGGDGDDDDVPNINININFMERIWTLLRSSADEDSSPPGVDADTDADTGAGTTTVKIANLADEVVRVRRAAPAARLSRGPDHHPQEKGEEEQEEEEARLRAAVDRTLRARDPVFALLQKRLLRALAAWLVSDTDSDIDAPETATAGFRSGAASPGPSPSPRPSATPVPVPVPVPVVMQTGRERPGTRVGLRLPRDPDSRKRKRERETSVFADGRRARARVGAIKGFEDEVLVREVGETFGRIAGVVDWTGRVWRDLVESGEIGGSLVGTRS